MTLGSRDLQVVTVLGKDQVQQLFPTTHRLHFFKIFFCLLENGCREILEFSIQVFDGYFFQSCPLFDLGRLSDGELGNGRVRLLLLEDCLSRLPMRRLDFSAQACTVSAFIVHVSMPRLKYSWVGSLNIVAFFFWNSFLVDILGLAVCYRIRRRSIKLYRRRSGISAYQRCSSGNNPNGSICCYPQSV